MAIWRHRAMFSAAWAVALLLPSCILPMPTNLPLCLPAHGHTYRVRDEQSRPAAGDGILVIHTFYDYAEERLDCYPIRGGKAVVPVTFDVRTTSMPMFGYCSWVIPTYVIFFINGHHADVYPLVPGRVFEDGFSFPSINRHRHIYGVKPRPDVLRVFPAVPHDERDILDQVAKGMMRARIIVGNRRRDGKRPTREELHNERQAKLVMPYVEARRKALDADDGAPPPAAPDVPVPDGIRPAKGWLSPSERAFRALTAGDNETLRQLLADGLDPDSYDVAPWTLLNRAVVLRNREAVRLLVEHGADVNRIVPKIAEAWFAYHDYKTADHETLRLKAEGYSALVLAACGGHLEILKFLEAQGAKTIAVDKGYTLLHAAADRLFTMHGDDGKGRREVIAYLLQKSHETNPVFEPCCPLEPGGTPLDLAVIHEKPETAAFLREHGGHRTARGDNAAAEDDWKDRPMR